MENFDELLKKYADFIVRVGVNPQLRFAVFIRIYPYSSRFIRGVRRFGSA